MSQQATSERIMGIGFLASLIASLIVGIGARIIMRIVARILGESLSIFLPFFGAVVGFGVNYFIAQATGNIAMRWYSGPAARAQHEIPAQTHP